MGLNPSKCNIMLQFSNVTPNCTNCIAQFSKWSIMQSTWVSPAVSRLEYPRGQYHEEVEQHLELSADKPKVLLKTIERGRVISQWWGLPWSTAVQGASSLWRTRQKDIPFVVSVCDVMWFELRYLQGGPAKVRPTYMFDGKIWMHSSKQVVIHKKILL